MIKLLLKFIFAFLLILWLTHSGKIDFSLIGQSTSNPVGWAICLTLIFGNLFNGAWRWKKIIQIKSQYPFQFFDFLKLTWIGCLFNTILPGAVSGDFVKLLYVRRIDPSVPKTYLLTSVFIDRILGIFALLIILGLSTILNYSELSQLSPQISKILNINALVFFGMAIFISTLFLPLKIQTKINNLIAPIPFVGKFLTNFFMQFWAVGQSKRLIFSLIFLSVVAHALGIFGFWCLIKPFIQYLPGANHTITISQIYTFLPLGFFATAIPITPAGIGIGHAAFGTLFSFYGVQNGASLFNFYFLGNIFINLLGVIPYLTTNKYSKNEMAEFA
jgi:uncharacterized membrane protein YbhN (UPF0104 family)